ncbi:MAG: hypothetical protein WCI77_10035 [Candidatus Omnitrophota bacterium]
MVYKYRSALALFISLNMHAALFFSVSFYVTTHSNPVFYFWPGILSSRDTDGLYPTRQLPEWVHASGRVFDKNDFFVGIAGGRPERIAVEKDISGTWYTGHELEEKKYLKEASDHLYLWERSLAMPYREEETVAYKVLVSPEGKVILSFPEKLPLDSYGSLAVQQYIKEATFFLKEKYFWTKVKSKVK